MNHSESSCVPDDVECADDDVVLSAAVRRTSIHTVVLDTLSGDVWTRATGVEYYSGRGVGAVLTRWLKDATSGAAPSRDCGRFTERV